MWDTASPGRWGLVAAAAACAAATPAAVWWLVGDLSAAVPAGASLDHLVRPPVIAPWAGHVIGVGAVLVLVGALTPLVRASRRGRFDRRWWAALLPVLGAGAIAGAGGRVVTAGTIGSNIGAGLTVIVGGPIVAALLLWAAGWSARLLLSREPPH